MILKSFKRETERLNLRQLLPEDATEYAKLGVSYRRVGRIDTREKARKWIARSRRSKDSCEIGIFLKERGKLIGTIELCHLRWFDFAAGEICYTVKKGQRRRGYATEAISSLIAYCFQELKFRKIYADTVPSNRASQRVLEKLGFRLEGRIRERRKSKGRWEDELDYGLLKREWKE